MGRIKTRESVKDIKILDKVAVVSERMKTALVRSKDQSTAMKSASTKMKNGFAAMRRSCVGARQAERRERMLHGRQRGKIRRPRGQASGADETRPSNLRSVLNAPSSSLLALLGNRP